jgi:di/tricarboxylate transporter
LLFGLFALAFSSRAAAAAAIIPTAIGFIESVGSIQMHSWGFAIIIYYVIQTAAVLPMNHPMAMMAYSSGTFSSGEMFKLGVPFMIIELILIALLASTYWKLVGLL